MRRVKQIEIHTPRAVAEIIGHTPGTATHTVIGWDPKDLVLVPADPRGHGVSRIPWSEEGVRWTEVSA